MEGFEQVHILSGHTHTNFSHIEGNIYEHTLGTLCGAWWTGSVCSDGTPSGYAIFEVDGKDLSWFYKSVGKDRDYQFRTTTRRLNNGQHRITVNVWNYDPQWKVSWYADGQYMGDLEQIEDYDELALSLYMGENLPTDRRGWVEPIQTTHLFYTQSDAQSIKIVVTDRFDNQYEETLNLQ